VGRFFRGGVRPVEIGHRISREMSDSRSVGVKGQPVVANHFVVVLAQPDLDRFADVQDSLTRELCDAARDTARDEGWVFMGPVQVELEADAGLRGGAITVRARMKEADGGVGVLHLSTGQQVGFLLTDRGSTNGTMVNDVRVSQHRLTDGDRIALGATTVFEFRAG